MAVESKLKEWILCSAVQYRVTDLDSVVAVTYCYTCTTSTSKFSKRMTQNSCTCTSPFLNQHSFGCTSEKALQWEMVVEVFNIKFVFPIDKPIISVL